MPALTGGVCALPEPLGTGRVPQVRQPAPACRGGVPGPKKTGEARPQLSQYTLCALHLGKITGSLLKLRADPEVDTP
jgi:hypothetical protein